MTNTKKSNSQDKVVEINCSSPDTKKSKSDEEILKEVCSNCRHTKRFHRNGCCSQPTCMCNCFIESGLIYTTDIFNAFEQGKSLAREDERKKIIHNKDLTLREVGITGMAHKMGVLDERKRIQGIIDVYKGLTLGEFTFLSLKQKINSGDEAE